MKEYERVTQKQGDPIIVSKRVYYRLRELEDKIENGTLVVVNKPFVALDYISNGKEYYAVKIAEEKDLAINLTKAEAEARLKELDNSYKENR